MTQEPPRSEAESEVPSEASAEEEEKSYAPVFFKGLALILLGVPLVAGVAWAGRGDFESWGSALIGIIFLAMIMMTSGSNGWWK